MIAIQGGYAGVNAGSTQRFISTNGDIFTTQHSGGTQNAGFVGGFLGVEYLLPYSPRPGMLAQTGIEYDYLSPSTVHGRQYYYIKPY